MSSAEQDPHGAALVLTAQVNWTIVEKEDGFHWILYVGEDERRSCGGRAETESAARDALSRLIAHKVLEW